MPVCLVRAVSRRLQVLPPAFPNDGSTDGILNARQWTAVDGSNREATR